MSKKINWVRNRKTGTDDTELYGVCGDDELRIVPVKTTTYKVLAWNGEHDWNAVAEDLISERDAQHAAARWLRGMGAGPAPEPAPEPAPSKALTAALIVDPDGEEHLVISDAGPRGALDQWLAWARKAYEIEEGGADPVPQELRFFDLAVMHLFGKVHGWPPPGAD